MATLINTDVDFFRSGYTFPVIDLSDSAARTPDRFEFEAGALFVADFADSACLDTGALANGATVKNLAAGPSRALIPVGEIDAVAVTPDGLDRTPGLGLDCPVSGEFIETARSIDGYIRENLGHGYYFSATFRATAPVPSLVSPETAPVFGRVYSSAPSSFWVSYAFDGGGFHTRYSGMSWSDTLLAESLYHISVYRAPGADGTTRVFRNGVEVRVVANGDPLPDDGAWPENAFGFRLGNYTMGAFPDAAAVKVYRATILDLTIASGGTGASVAEVDARGQELAMAEWDAINGAATGYSAKPYIATA